MKNKEEFLKKLSEAIDKIEDKDAVLDYFSISFSNYSPDKNSERKLSYFQVDIDYDTSTESFTINDRSESFKCEIGCSFCEERGYCNGDC